MQRTRFALWPRWRAAFLVIAVAALLLSGCATQPPRHYRVGVLSGLDFFAASVDGFRAKLAELGYIEGQQITYDVQKTNFDRAAYRRILNQFVAERVDLILVFPTEAALEAKAATRGTDIPVVFAFAFIEEVELVASVHTPGGNITGVRVPGPDIALKRFEIMRELVPHAQRIWIPYQRDYPTVASQLAMLAQAAEAAGVTLIEVPARDAAGLAADLANRAGPDDPGLDAILLLAEPLSVQPDAFAVMAHFAAAHQLPIGGALVPYDTYGAIFEANVDSVAGGKQAALLADKIFKGTPPGSIPVVAADVFFRIDYRMAQTLGITVPDGVLRQADEVIR